MKFSVSHISYLKSHISVGMKFSVSHISNLKSQIFLILILCLSKGAASAQVTPDTLRLTLQEVVELARQNSIAAKQAVAVKETRYWEYRTFKSNYQPQL